MTELEGLLVKEQIRTLQARYVRLADSKDWHALSGLFDESATFTAYDVAGKVVAVMTGRREISSGIDAGVGSATVLHRLFSYEIEVQSDSKAHGIWSMEDWIDHQSGTEPPAFRTMRGYGHYHVDYRRMDGVWRIACLDLRRTRVDYTF